jgi:hypothetical protein
LAERFTYHAAVLEALHAHGLAPDAATPPARVREALSDLYRYEIRRLRDRLLAGDVRKPDYVGHVIALRKQYWLLSVPVEMWTHPQTG